MATGAVRFIIIITIVIVVAAAVSILTSIHVTVRKREGGMVGRGGSDVERARERAEECV